MKILAKELK